jgi:hypothetical protein
MFISCVSINCTYKSSAIGKAISELTVFILNKGERKLAKDKKQARGDDQIYKDGTQRAQEDHEKMLNPDKKPKGKKK